MDTESFIGRQLVQHDTADPQRIARLAALLDHEADFWPGHVLPPLGHWLCFQPDERQSLIGPDGHPRLGHFLPDLGLPRRMWAGGRIAFLNDIPLGARIVRRSTITSATAKTGTTGDLVFVTVQHDISADGVTAISEEQDLVYRAISAPQNVPGPAARSGKHERSVTCDPVMLFRYSALTFNAHRIHYDRDYARSVELYPGLVIHGPLIATLLMDHFLQNAAGASPRTFSFRAQRPLYADTPFDLCLDSAEDGADIWTRNASGDVTMTGRIETR